MILGVLAVVVVVVSDKPVVMYVWMLNSPIGNDNNPVFVEALTAK